MRSSIRFLSGGHGRKGLILALSLAVSVVGCFKDPKLDDTQPRRCQSDNSCPYGYVCGPDGYCCASSDGKVCSAPGATGGMGGRGDGAAGTSAPIDGPARGTGGGGGGSPGTGGASGFGGALGGDGSWPGPDANPDVPLGGAGGGADASAFGGAGGATGPGGATGQGGTVGTGGVVSTGGVRASGGVIGSGGMGTGGIGAGGTGAGGQTTCGASQKPCNGECIPSTECCGGCGGNTPVCSAGTCEGKPNGATCTTATAAQCASGFCADGVCCNVACTGVCEACNLVPSGTCSPSTTPRAGQTCSTDGTACGGRCDGTEAHRQACYFSPASTSCGVASCNVATKTLTHARQCSGSGECEAATTEVCPRGCAADGSAACATSCPTGTVFCSNSCVASDNTHCGTSCENCSTHTDYTKICRNSVCVECAQPSDCFQSFGASALCDGQNRCQCRQPSTSNRLRQISASTPGLDGSLGGWTVEPCASCPSPLVNYSSQDADNCARSGSAHLEYYAFAFGSFSRCLVADPNTTYYLGYTYKIMPFNVVNPESTFLECTATTFQGGTCSGDALQTTLAVPTLSSETSTSWASKSDYIRTFNATGSVLVSCALRGTGEAWLDWLYFNTSANF